MEREAAEGPAVGGWTEAVAATREVMAIDDVAAYLGMGRSTIYKMVQAGEIPYAKFGTMLRFPKLLVDRWLAENTVHPARTLLDEFELLYEKFHLKKFLQAKGVHYQELTEEQLVEHLRVAVHELRSYEQLAGGKPPGPGGSGEEP